MKYWSSSRVGAVPQATAQSSHPTPDKKEKGGASRFNRKKGITMEDLKKQTAIRLAQEQNQQQQKGRSTEGRGTTPSSPDITSPARSGTSDPSKTNLGRSPAALGSSPAVNRGSSGPRRSRDAPSPSPVVPVGGGVSSYPTTMPPSAESAVMAPASFEASMGPPASLEHSHMPSGSIPCFVPSTGGMMMHSSDMGSRTNTTTTTISMHSSSSSSESMSKRKKSKLPHGLTVQELKEMTKARLQAEAAEKTGATAAGLSGHATQTLHADQSVMRDNASPLPPTFLHRPRPHSSRGGDAWSSHDSRSEAWETGSVSTVASEYLGSESAYGIGSFGGGGGPEDPSPSPYMRPPMGSGMGGGGGGPVHAFSDHPPSDVVMFTGAMAPPPAYHYDSTSGHGNRRRAATLSPRVGLSYLDESREVFPDHDTTPMLPSFSSPSAHGQFPMRSRSGYGPDRFTNGSNYRLGGSSPMEFNRPRTSSATSLPPISHTSEEFSLDQSPFRRAPNAGLGSLAVSRDMAPSPSVTGLADAFQDAASPFVSPPPGLGGFERHHGVPTYSTNYGLSSGLASENFMGAAAGSPPPADPRVRASTWGGATSLDSLFGPSLIDNSVGRDVGHLRELQLQQQQQQRAQDSLCDDLESILKLNVGPSDHLFPPPGL